MLKNYIVNGKQFQYEEGTQPKEAVEVEAASRKAAEVENTAAKPTNKARKAATK